MGARYGPHRRPSTLVPLPDARPGHRAPTAGSDGLQTSAMPTPVGPAPRDPDDPDLWDEWYDESDDRGPSRFAWPVRLVALVVVVAVALAVVAAL